MLPRRVLCQICNYAPFKYTCADCRVVYCSVPCYKEHKSKLSAIDLVRKETNCEQSSKQTTSLSDARGVLDVGTETTGQSELPGDVKDDLPMGEPVRLRPLTTLKWPNVEPPPAIPDPLTANDPKPLRLSHYEAIATSSKIRALLEENPQLPEILTAIDKLSGSERERAFEGILGVSAATARTPASQQGSGFYWLPGGTDENAMEALRLFVQTLSSVMVTAERADDRQPSPVALETADY